MHFTLCDLFSDLTENAVDSGADAIGVELNLREDSVSLTIQDNGRGMTQEELRKAQDPFWTDGVKHPGRRVGLGIPFLIQTAEDTGGKWNIQSKSRPSNSHGTTVTCSFDLRNIDTPPVGDVTGYFRQILSFNRPYEMTIRYTRSREGGGDAVVELKRSELLDAMGLSEEGIFSDASSLALLAQYLENQMED
jgi:hypothetical protein